jgi:hypothetical protein
MKFHLHADPNNPRQILGKITLTTPAELLELGHAMMETKGRLDAEREDGGTVTKAAAKGAYVNTGRLQLFDAFHKTPEGAFCKEYESKVDPSDPAEITDGRLHYSIMPDSAGKGMDIRITFLDDLIRQDFKTKFGL